MAEQVDRSVLSVVFLAHPVTEARRSYAVRTIRGVRDHLKYADGDLLWHIVADGCPDDRFQALLEYVGAAGFSVAYMSRNKRAGYGANANWAWEHAASDVTLWLEDDWELTRDFDITPYVRLLNNEPAIGMVRLGHLPIDLRAYSEGYEGRMYLNLPLDQMYAYSGNPHLKHRRFRDTYGRYPEGHNPGDTELAYGAQIREAETKAKIVWPLAIGDNHPFGHIGAEQSYVA